MSRVIALLFGGLLILGAACSTSSSNPTSDDPYSDPDPTTESLAYKLAVAHFDVDDGENVDCYAPSGTVGVVIGQRPCPGLFSSLPEGSKVMLWIRIPDPDCVAPPDADWGCA